MAAQVIGSAVAQEAVSQVLSRFKENHREKSDAKEHVERLEMAHIKLETVLETSQKWNVTSAPLLRWRSKLKRAAQECDQTLRRCKQRLQEEEEMQQQGVRSYSLAKRIAHAAMSLVTSISGRGNDEEVRGSAVRRFEWFAEGAGEFLRYVEHGGTPRPRYTFFAPLIRHLLAGEGTMRCFVRGGQHLSVVLRPLSPPDQHGNGMEGVIVILYEDGNAPQNNLVLSLILRLAESTDIVGVVVRCMQLFTAPLLISIAEIVKTKLTQLPTQDLCWVPDAYSVLGHNGQHDSPYTTNPNWFRPNPLCCQRQDHHYAAGTRCTSPSEPLPSDNNVYLEPVTQVCVVCHVALSDWSNTQRAGFPYLKLGVHFWPHASPSCEDLPPVVGGAATEMINGEATQLQHGLYSSNICLQELLDEILVRRAEHYLRGGASATSYQMLWRSTHGRAYLQVEKASWRATMGVRRQKGRRGKKVEAWTSGISEFMCTWIDHAPAQVQALVVEWIQKQERLPLPLLLKTNSCIRDCPIMLLSLQYLRSSARKIKSLSTC